MRMACFTTNRSLLIMWEAVQLRKVRGLINANAARIAGMIFFLRHKTLCCKVSIRKKGKGCSYSYKETYNDVKYLTSFYFNNSIPAVDEVIEFESPDG